MCVSTLRNDGPELAYAQPIFTEAENDEQKVALHSLVRMFFM